MDKTYERAAVVETGWVVVKTWTGDTGRVVYRTADGWVGVEMTAENGRVDEWQSWQLTEIDAEEWAGLAAAKLAK